MIKSYYDTYCNLKKLYGSNKEIKVRYKLEVKKTRKDGESELFDI